MAILRLLLVFTLACSFSASARAQIFGGDSGTSQLNPAPVKQDSEVKQTSWPSLPLPKITMPKISMPDMSTVTAPFKSGYSKVTAGTKSAWEGTKEMFSFGKNDASAAKAQAGGQEKQGFWQRLISNEPEKPDGPQTVGEWMSQPRLDH